MKSIEIALMAAAISFSLPGYGVDCTVEESVGIKICIPEQQLTDQSLQITAKEGKPFQNLIVMHPLRGCIAIKF